MNSGGRISAEGARTGHTHPASDVDAIPRSALNVKGDLVVASGNDAFYVLPVGAEGTALTPSLGAPAGVAWSPVAQAVHTHTQSQSHNSPDTDTSASALHHTLGDSSTQAAPGNHTHADIVPIGAILPFAGATAPAKWLLCDGTPVSRTTYADLFAVCGTAYDTPGSPAPSTHFRLPNLQGRAPYGLSGDAAFATMGKSGGAASVVLTESNIPSHTHTTPSHDHTAIAHEHTTGAHTHSTPDHTHTLTMGKPGNHGHSVSASTASDGSHQHDTRVDNLSNVRGTGTGSLSRFAGTNTSNSTAAAGDHTHAITVTQTAAGDHDHALNWTSSGNGTSGEGQGVVGSATVTINSGGSGTSGAAGSGASVSTQSPYLTVRYIIKAL